jgi:hypothetical protein
MLPGYVRAGTTQPPELRVGEARDRYLAENGFDVAGYTAPTFRIRVFRVTWTLPNWPARRRVVPLHDLHHVVTGYGTDLVGEAETSAWELRCGGLDSLFLWCFKLGAVSLGLVLAPSRVVSSFRRARGQRNLYGDPRPYRELLALSVGELRAGLGVPEDGLADRSSRLHSLR